MTSETIYLNHTVGDALPITSLRVVWQNNSTSNEIAFENGNMAGTDTTFDSGDEWSAPPFPSEPNRQFAENESVTLYLVHEPSNTILYSGNRLT